MIIKVVTFFIISLLAEEGVPPKICNNIGYFGQSWERQEGADTTLSILREFQCCNSLM